MVAQIDKVYAKTRPTRLWSRLVSYGLFEGRPVTTRGQWINPVLFRLFALEKRLPQLRKVGKPVFILGTGRSGTTILGVVLSMQPDVGFLNEPKAMWASLRDDEDLIGSYHRGNAFYRLGIRDVTPGLVGEVNRLYGAYLRFSLNSRVVDKYPEMIFRVPFLRKVFPDARFLFLSRNGWDTCSSIEAWSGRLGKQVDGETHDWWGVNGRKWELLVDQLVPEHEDLAVHRSYLRGLHDHRLRAAVEWIVTMREGMALLRDNPGDVLHVPFSRLCKEPDLMMNEITRFAGLAPDEIFQNYARQTLKCPTAYKKFELPQEIAGAFVDTNKKLSKISQ